MGNRRQFVGVSTHDGRFHHCLAWGEAEQTHGIPPIGDVID